MADESFGCSKCCASNSGGIGGKVVCAVVAGTNPPMGISSVPVDTSISILFSEVPDPSSCHPGTIIIDPPVQWTLSEGNSPEEMVLIPTEPLLPNQEYTVLVENVVTLESEPILPYLLKFST